MNRSCLALAMLLVTAGCTVGPDYVPPADPRQSGYDLADMPAQERSDGKGPDLSIAADKTAAWWRALSCPSLDALEQDALAQNHTVAAASATLRQAEQVVLQVRANSWPQADLGAGVQRNGAGGFTAAGGGTSSNFFSIGPSFSYMADLFGATARAIEQSEASADLQREQLAAAQLTVAGGVASQAIAIAGARLQIASSDEIIANDRQNLSMVERQFAAGKAARGDVLTAQSQYLNDRAQSAQLRQQLSVARHALAVLVSRAPSDWTPPDFTIGDFMMPNPLPLTLPARLVHRRPDILAAEKQLHAASAAIGVAEAQFYPTMTLSAAVTQQAVSPSQLFNGVNNLWNVGANLTTPLFHGGALSAQKQAALEAFKAQLASYEQTVTVAFGQVADSLRALDHDAEQRQDAEEAYDVASASLALQQASYKNGKTSLLQLLTAQRSFAQARQSLASAQIQQLQDVVQYYLAIGGGGETN